MASRIHPLKMIIRWRILAPRRISHFFRGNAFGKLRKLRRSLCTAHELLYVHANRLSLQKHLRRSEARSARLLELQALLIKELNLYYHIAHGDERSLVFSLLQEDRALQRRASQWKYQPVGLSEDAYLTHEKNTLCQQDLFLIGLISLIRRALKTLSHVVKRLSPTSAYRVRHLLFESEIILSECLPPTPKAALAAPWYSLAVHPTLLITRFLISVSVVPLVLLFESHLRPTKRAAPAPRSDAAPLFDFANR